METLTSLTLIWSLSGISVETNRRFSDSSSPKSKSDIETVYVPFPAISQSLNVVGLFTAVGPSQPVS